MRLTLTSHDDTDNLVFTRELLCDVLSTCSAALYRSSIISYMQWPAFYVSKEAHDSSHPLILLKWVKIWTTIRNINVI